MSSKDNKDLGGKFRSECVACNLTHTAMRYPLCWPLIAGAVSATLDHARLEGAEKLISTLCPVHAENFYKASAQADELADAVREEQAKREANRGSN